MPQYDVENRFSYYKSYSDNIMAGPSFPVAGSTTWDRTVSGSIVSGSEEYKTAATLTDFIYKKLQPYYKSGEVRYLRLPSNRQVIKDSIVPDILSIYQTGFYGAGSLVQWRQNSLFRPPPDQSILLLFSKDGLSLTGSDGQRVNNIEWPYSFPYEKKYYAIGPEDNSAIVKSYVKYYFAAQGAQPAPYDPIFQILAASLTINKSTISFGNTKILPHESKSINIFVDYLGYYNPSSSPSPTNPSAQWSFAADIGTYYNVSQRNFFFFGNNPSPLYLNYHERQGNLIQNQGAYSISGSVGCTIEGWKYGLYNGIPTKFSCVFRQNRFGQFRDMLEGRVFTKTYNDPKSGGPMDEAGGINFISASALLGESDNWLTSSIYKGTNVVEAYRVNPYGSGIFDKEYRASQPWHDDDARLGT